MTEETLFHEALARPATERAAFLDAACAGQPDLRAAVEALLAAHEAPDRLLDQPPAAVQLTTTDYHPPLGPGVVIAGRYSLVEKIGEGGMGEVWVAKQTEPVKRRVALKLIKAGMDSRAVLQRFEQERQALALMDHPNIARVFDGGMTADRQPFFVMELVNGLALTRFCDEAKLTPRERLELFVPICQAVQHAHQKGIVHRDLKPANILVTLIDGKPTPKIIDFGVAKATAGKLTDESLTTQFGAVVGTLEYMAPEQAGYAGDDIDTRADIYSLGVILYELLTGLRPLDARRLKAAARTEMIRILREEEPSRPSTRLSTEEALPSLAALRQTEPKKLMALLRGELDWVVMKCLEKQRDRRYETANGLARELQRYLADEPVEARPPSAGYRLRKFLRRHQGPVVAASLVLLALVGGIAGTTWGLLEAQSQEQHARAEADAKEQARQAEAQQRALAEAQKAKAVAAAAAAQAAQAQAQKRLQQIEKANEILGSIFANLNPDKVARNERPLEAILVEQLDQAVAQLEGEAIGDARVVAALQATLGRSLLSLGERGKASVLLEKAHATRLAQLGPDHHETLATMNNLALAYHYAGKWDLAVPLLAETLKRTKAQHGPAHRDTLTSMDNLAGAYRVAGQWDRALPLCEEAYRLRKAQLGLDHPDTLTSMGHLAQVYQYMGKLDLAVPLCEQALAGRKARFGPKHPDTLHSMHALAMAYVVAGKRTQALALLEQVLPLRKARLGPEHPDTLLSMNALAGAYRSINQLDKALSLLLETLTLQETKLGRSHPDTLLTLGGLGMCYLSAGRLKEAIPLLEEAYQAARKYPKQGYFGAPLLDAYARAEENIKLAQLLQDPRGAVRQVLPRESPQLAGLLAQAGRGLLEQKQWVEAEPLLRECLAIRTKSQPDDWVTFNTQSLLGAALLGQQKYAEAEPLLHAGYEGMRKQQARIPPTARTRPLQAVQRLVQLYEATERTQEAARWRQELEALRAAAPVEKQR